MTAETGAFGRVTILGAGLMGHGIGLVHALGGAGVVLQDRDPAVLASAPGRLRASGQSLVDARLLTPADLETALARIRVEPDPAAALAEADLVVEAITEAPEAKREVFAVIDAHAPLGAVIASNTSYLDVFPLIPARRQARAMIVHWYAPPHAIDLVDVVPGPETEPGLAERLYEMLRAIGKKPVLLRQFLPGYIANRIQTAISLEVFRLLDEGHATAEDIDTAIRFGIAERLVLFGHLGRIDHAGLRLAQLNLANRSYHPPEVRGHSDTLDRLVADGRDGVTTGAGFHDYPGRTPEQLFRRRDARLFALKRALADIGREETAPETTPL